MTSTGRLPVTSEILVPRRASSHDRRLSDKILEAFSLAYAAGEPGIAGLLRRALEELVGRGCGPLLDRRADDPLEQARRWVEFVDARDAYRRARERSPGDAEALEDTRHAMVEAYRRWSYG